MNDAIWSDACSRDETARKQWLAVFAQINPPKFAMLAPFISDVTKTRWHRHQSTRRLAGSNRQHGFGYRDPDRGEVGQQLVPVRRVLLAWRSRPCSKLNGLQVGWVGSTIAGRSFLSWANRLLFGAKQARAPHSLSKQSEEKDVLVELEAASACEHAARPDGKYFISRAPLLLPWSSSPVIQRKVFNLRLSC